MKMRGCFLFNSSSLILFACIVPLKGCIKKSNEQNAGDHLPHPPFHCCFSAAEDNTEKRNIWKYLTVDLTDNKTTSVKMSPQKPKLLYVLLWNAFHCRSISITHTGFLMVPSRPLNKLSIIDVWPSDQPYQEIWQVHLLLCSTIMN